MSANDKQVGGQHYKGMTPDIPQHWDIVSMHNLDYFQGQITKYVMRWKNKNGVEDLLKAQHFLEKYIELNKPKEFVTNPVVAKAWAEKMDAEALNRAIQQRPVDPVEHSFQPLSAVGAAGNLTAQHALNIEYRRAVEKYKADMKESNRTVDSSEPQPQGYVDQG